MDQEQKMNLLLERTAVLPTIQKQLENLQASFNTMNIRIKSLEEEQQELSTKVTSIETSQSFVSGKYDELVVEQKKLKEAVESLQNQNRVLNQKVTDLDGNLKEEKIGRNAENQYHCTTHNIKLCGIPFQVGEEQSGKFDQDRTEQNVLV